MSKKNSNGYISLQEATKYCNYTQEYLSLRARQGKLKAVKFGRNWVTKKEWLEEYLKRVEEYKNSNNLKAKNIPGKLSLQPKTKLLPRLRFGFVVALTLVLFAASLFFALPNFVKQNLGGFGRDSFYRVGGFLTNQTISPLTREISQRVDRGLAKQSQNLTGEVSNYTYIISRAGGLAAKEIAESAKDFYVIQIPSLSKKFNKKVDAFFVSSGRSLVNGSKYLRDGGAAIFTALRNINSHLAEIGKEGGQFMRGYFSWLGSLPVRASQKIAQSYLAADEFLEKELADLTQNIGYGTLTISQKISQSFTNFGYQIADARKIINNTFREYSRQLIASLENVSDNIVENYLAADNFLEKKIARVWQIVVKPFQPKVVVVERPSKETERRVKELEGEIKKLKEESTVPKERVKQVEVSRITKVEPVREVTKEKVVEKIPSRELAKIKKELSSFALWGTDIKNLQAITKKLKAQPAYTLASTAPIYIASQGIQVGGQGTFASLGVSGSAGINDLGVGGSASIGSDSSDNLTVNAVSTFYSPVVIESTLTVGTSTLTIDSSGNVSTSGNITTTGAGNLTVAGDLTVAGAQVFSGDQTITGVLDPNQVAAFVLTGNITGSGSPDITGIGTVSASNLSGIAMLGNLNLNSHNITNASEVRFSELAANGTNYVGFKAPNSITSNVIWTLPSADGTSGYALTTDGSGNLSWGQAGVNDATYLTLSLHDSLTAERVLTAGTNISITDGGANGNLVVATIANPSFATSVTTPTLTTSSGALTLSTGASAGADDIIFSPAGTEKMRILENGDLFFEKGAYDVNLTVAAPAAARTYTIPDFGADVSFVGTNRTISTTSPLSGGGDLSANRTFSLAGLNSLGTGNYLVGVNSGATAWEYKTIASLLTAGTNISISGTTNATIATIANPSFATSVTTPLLNTADNAASLTLNIPVSGTDSTSHTIQLQIDGNTGLSVAATGDGAGGVGDRTITIGDASADISLTDANWSITGAGAASFATVNKLSITAPATGSTLTIADGKTLTINNTLTFSGTDSTTFTFPGASDTVVTLAATQVLTNKTLTDSSTYFQDETDNTKKLQFQLSGITASTTRTLTVPDASGTMALGTGTANHAAYWSATNTLAAEQYLALSRGGTGAGLTATAGGVVYSTASALAINSAGTSGQALISGGTGAPTWGTLGTGSGGTGLTSIGTANQLLGVDSGATGLEYKTLSGTTNQISVTHAANSITLSTPQDIHTSATPQFARLGLGTAADATNILTATSASTSDLSKTLNVSHTGAITGTGYAGYFSKTGASTTNVGLYATASGATNNYAAIFESGNVGIGTTTPQSKLDLRGDLLIPAQDTIVDCDGSASTGAGTCDSHSDGTALVAVDSADDLCTDSLTSPTIVFIDSDGNCNTTDGTITNLLGTAAASTQYTNVDSSWAYVDSGATAGAYDDGEDLYIDKAPALKYFSSGGSKFIFDSINGNVGIGTTTPEGRLQIVGPSGWDKSTRFYLTNGATDYGRTNLILTGRMQGTNDAWAFGSNARNSIVFNENIVSASGENVGGIGTEEYSIQLEGNSKALGFLSTTNGNSPNMVLLQNGNIGIGTTGTSAPLHLEKDLGVASGSHTLAMFRNIPPGAGSAGMDIMYEADGTSVTNSQLYFPGQLDVQFNVYPAGDVMTLTTDGNVGIGTTDPGGYKLKVAGTVAITPTDISATTGMVIDTSTGQIGYDIAETYSAAEPVEPGDVVKVIRSTECKNQNENSKCKENIEVAKTDKPYDNAIIGVVSTRPAISFEGSKLNLALLNYHPNPNKPNITLAGRVPVKLSLENGPIKVGDPLTSSSIPGVAMKVTKAGRVIGIALEPLSDKDFENCSNIENSLNLEGVASRPYGARIENCKLKIGRILVFINPHWYGGQLNENGLLDGANDNGDEAEGQSLIGSFANKMKQALLSLGLSIKDGIVHIKELVTKVMKTENLEVGSSNKPTGITLYDEETGQPYCLKIKGGEIVKSQGKCSEVNDTPTSNTPSSNTPTNNTPTNNTPANDTPTNDTPTNDTPANDTPANDTAADNTPTNDTAANDTAANNTPTNPTDNTPTNDIPTDDTAINDIINGNITTTPAVDGVSGPVDGIQ